MKNVFAVLRAMGLVSISSLSQSQASEDFLGLIAILFIIGKANVSKPDY